MTTIIAAILSFAVAVAGAWFAYRMFSEKGPVVGPFRFVETISKRKENGMDVIEYKIGLPVSPSTDVAKKILTVRRADTGGGMFEPIEAVELPNEQTEVWRKAVQDTRVDLELVAVDDSGNRSEPVYKYFTALDTIPPVLTGESSLMPQMTVEAVGEATAEPEGPPAETPAADAEDAGEAPPAGRQAGQAGRQVGIRDSPQAAPRAVPSGAAVRRPKGRAQRKE